MYVGGFESPDDLLRFVRSLAENLSELHFAESADELLDWSGGVWSTGSEFVGELGVRCRGILARDGNRLPQCLRDDLERCLTAYREVFPR
jgi:hypothetical protein